MLSALFQLRDSTRSASLAFVLSLDTLTTFSRFDSTDARDKIFALWGFVDPLGEHTALLQPDYSLSTEQTFINATRYVILTRKSPDILAYHPHAEPSVATQIQNLGRYSPMKGPLDLPSWVLDWRYEVSQDGRGLLAHSREVQFTFDDVVNLPSDSRLLKAKGISLGCILEIFGNRMLPYALDKDASDASMLDTVKYFNLHIVARGQNVLCQYLRFTFGTMEPELLKDKDTLGAPLDILASLAGGRIELGDGKGAGHILLH